MCWEPRTLLVIWKHDWMLYAIVALFLLQNCFHCFFFFPLAKYCSEMLDKSDLGKGLFWLTVGGCRPACQGRHGGLKASSSSSSGSRGLCRLATLHAQLAKRGERWFSAGCLLHTPFLFSPAPQPMGWCLPHWQKLNFSGNTLTQKPEVLPRRF